MGATPSAEVVCSTPPGEPVTPFSIRRHPACPNATEKNPPEYPTMKELMLEAFRKFKTRPYLGERPLINGNYGPKYEWKTYQECEQIATNFGSGLASLNIKVGSMMGVYAHNCYQWLHCIDASCLYGFVIVSLYDSLGVDSLQYLVKHSQMTSILVSSKNAPKLIDILEVDKSKVENFILLDDTYYEQAKSRCGKIGINTFTFNGVCEIGKSKRVEFPTFDPESPHFICYSSGTTGNPKGVIISHRACVSNTLGAKDLIRTTEDTRHISYLPLAHVFERAAIAITGAAGGCIGFISGDVRNLTVDMGILKPTHLAAVPRVMNRFYDAVQKKLANSSFIVKGVFWGCWYAKKFCINHQLPTFLFDKIAFAPINKQMGGCVTQFVVGGAAMDPNIHEFLQVATGVPLRTGYGLTEAGSGNMCVPMDIRFCYPGTVGGPLRNVEVRLEPIDGYDDPECGEVLIGGPCLSSGYLHDPDATANLFVDETHSWIHTGDVAKWDQNNYMKIVDRMRSIFKLSQGEYVAAELVTQVYEESPLVKQIFVYGDSLRTCLVAVVIPEISEVAKFFGKGQISEEEFAKLCREKKLNNEIMKQLNDLGKKHGLFGYQFVKAIHIDSNEWTIENNLLTPTFKYKRKAIGDHYKDEIESLYAALDAAAPK
ncbi:AMP-binding enzyme family protein [Tritrichomonas foetus]|uniref:AMP-binding enzyme family protein n=1 Tax=Tritrichomonas foetus TaxID=1144522 RepID=A0A1J4K2F0_9EUKA|nr:AMP-binding enzyme family protein [Tritrichomonas foetus]|eukprot:OHT03669.1 AMP-binding enzyme family protein [Tritrichomonas foetus]